MRQYLIRLKRKAQKKWWWALLILTWWLVQDRLTTFANKAIDESSPDVLKLVPAALNWAAAHPSGLLLGVVIVLGASIALGAYFDRDSQATTPSFTHEGPDFKREIRTKGDASVYMRDASGETTAGKSGVFIKHIDPPQSPISLRFPDEISCSEFIDEAATIGFDKVSRRIFWVDVVNESDKNVRNVRAYISSVKELSVHGASDPHPVIGSKIFHLKFGERSDVLDFAPHMCARLYLVSYANNFLPGFIRIEGENKEILHQDKAWEFSVRVTADGVLPTEKTFAASVDNGMLRLSIL